MLLVPRAACRAVSCGRLCCNAVSRHSLSYVRILYVSYEIPGTNKVIFMPIHIKSYTYSKPYYLYDVQSSSSSVLLLIRNCFRLYRSTRSRSKFMVSRIRTCFVVACMCDMCNDSLPRKGLLTLLVPPGSSGSLPHPPASCQRDSATDNSSPVHREEQERATGDRWFALLVDGACGSWSCG